MTTRNIVPNVDGEGSVGKADKKWGDIQTHKINGVNFDEIGNSEIFNGNFAGEGGETVINHTFGTNIKMVDVVPTTNPGGYLGEVWVRFDSTKIYIGNSGSHTGTFKVFVQYSNTGV